METESQSGVHLSGKPCDGGQPCPPLRLNHPLGLCEGASFRAPPWMEDYQDYLLPGTYLHPRSPALSATPTPTSSSGRPAFLPCAPACGIHTQRPTLVTHSCPPPSSFPSSSNQRPACVFEGVQIQAAPPPSPPTCRLPPFKTSSNACPSSEVGSCSISCCLLGLSLSEIAETPSHPKSPTSHHIKSHITQHPHFASHPPSSRRLASPSTAACFDTGLPPPARHR